MSTRAEPYVASPPVVVAGGVRYSYRNVPVLADVSLVVESRSQLAITGRSGSGKTTLLLILAGLLHPGGGGVRWPGLADSVKARRNQIGMVFQAPSLIPELTAAENVSLPQRLRGAGREAAAAATHLALDCVGLLDAGDALPGQLSGGMQQRVAIARVLAGRPRLVLADEPTGALDRKHAFGVMSALRDQTLADGAALLVATHDEELANLLGDRAILDDGRLRAGTPR